MSLNDRIREARVNKGITQEQLGELVGVAKTTIAGYEKNREPTAAKLGQIADALGVGVDFLFQDEVKAIRDNKAAPDEMDIIKKYRRLDQYGKEAVNSILDVELKRCINEGGTVLQANGAPYRPNVLRLPDPVQMASAGRGALADDDSADELCVYYNPHTAKADYVMTVSGDSMEPEIFDGDRLLVREQPAIEDGELGIFIRDGERYVKRLVGNVLISSNPNYADIPLNEDSRCIGKVIDKLDPAWIAE